MPLPEPLVEVVLGCVLHDIGKPVQRAGIYDSTFERETEREDRPRRDTHSYIGAQFMYDIFTTPSTLGEAQQEWLREHDDDKEVRSREDVVDAIRYHHARALSWAQRNSRLRADSPAYIAYIADNIAAGADRREAYDQKAWNGYDATTNLKSVFNVFGDSPGDAEFPPVMLKDTNDLTLPTTDPTPFTSGQYVAIVEKLRTALTGLDFTRDYVTSLLTVLEATLTYVPSSTATAEVADISLYDHVKLTGAFGSAIWHWLREKNIDDYRGVLFDRAQAFYDEEAFLLVSLDVSGIQDFIYTIHSQGAAKQLRARSFYLEILVENAIDNLLDALELSRANLLYSGGGHAYLVAPNTASARAALADFEEGIDEWLLEEFGTALWLGLGWVPFCARTVMNSAQDADTQRAAYADLYRTSGRILAEKKLHRYDAQALKLLNSQETSGVECKVCQRVTPDLTDDSLCRMCEALAAASRHILNDGFAYVSTDSSGGLPVSAGEWLFFAPNESRMREALDSGGVRRVYGLNRLVTGLRQSIHLWVGNFEYDRDFSFYADRSWTAQGEGQPSVGIRRLGVLRLDVDDLGKAFVAGFSSQDDGRYNTFSRSATFSRAMSLFFRHFINQVLDQPDRRFLTQGQSGPRKATIIYSGGDDVFIVGAWDDVLEFALDLRRTLVKFTGGKLTISGGIGLYPDKFPISVMAREVGDLESQAKRGSKDALALFDRDYVVRWEDLETRVLGAKYLTLKEFLAASEDKGHSFAYSLLSLLREKRAETGDSKGPKTISFARWVYLLSRAEPADPGEKTRFRQMAEQLHDWFADPKDSKELELALWLYAYTTRQGE